MPAQAAFAYGVQDQLPMPNEHMLHWVARAAKRLRERAGRKQVHVAAALDRDQSTIYRFEQNGLPDGPFFGWPGETDAYLAAYAEDLGIADVKDIWALALEMWREGRDLPDRVEALIDPKAGPGAGGLAGPVEELARGAKRQRAGSGQMRRAPGRRAAG
jgi:hypothetical protein